MRKKVLVVLCLILAMAFGCAFAACTQETPPADDGETHQTHTFGEWTVITPATCTQEGTQERTCTECSFKETQSIPVDPNAHANFSEWTTVREATCTDEGERVHTCLDCNTQVREDIPVDPDAHMYGSWSVQTPSTCSVQGTEVRTCIFCSHPETRSLPLDPDTHVWEEGTTVPSTCAVQGYTEYTCSDCHETKKEYLPFTTDHTFAASAGFDQHCSVCGELLDETVTLETTSVVGEVGYPLVLKGDFELVFTFENYGGTNVNGWHNWSLRILPAIYDDTGALRILRNDPNGFLDIRARDVSNNLQFRYLKEQGEYSYTPNIVDGTNDAAFAAAMKDATCTATIVREGNVLTITVVAVSNVEGYGEYRFTATVPVPYEALSVALTGESCTLELTSAKLASGQKAADSVTPSGGTEQLEETVSFSNTGREYKGYSITLDEGDFDVSFTFENLGGARKWDSFYFNLYKCFTERGNDTDVLWAFAEHDELTYGYTFTQENWQGDGTNNGLFSFGYQPDEAVLIEQMKNAKVYVRFVREDGILSVYGLAYTNDTDRTPISYLLYRSQGTPYDGPITIRLMGEGCTVNLTSVLVYSGTTLTDHKWGTWTTVSEPVCGTAGSEERTCDACGETESRPIPATGEHTWSSWSVTEEATCGTEGEEERSCGVCGATESQVIPATGDHTFGESAGFDQRCSVCGELLDETVTLETTSVVGEIGYPLVLEGDFELVFNFENYGGENINGWHNWSLRILPAIYDDTGALRILGNDANGFLDIRARDDNGNYQFRYLKEQGTYAYTPNIVTGTNDAALAAAMKDATCTATIVREGNVLTITVVAVSNVEGYGEYRFIATVPVPYEALSVALTGESCKLELTSVRLISGENAADSVTVTEGTELLEDPYSFTNAGGREYKGYSITLDEGDFDVSFTFENLGGIRKWDSFYFNLYKCFTERGNDTDVLWAFAVHDELTYNYTFTSENWTGQGVNHLSVYSYGSAPAEATLIEQMKNAKVYVRFVREDGILSVYGLAYTNDGNRTPIAYLLYRSQGTPYDGPITIRLMSEGYMNGADTVSCTINVTSVRVYSGTILTDHKWGEWTDTADGGQQRVCTSCNATETKSADESAGTETEQTLSPASAQSDAATVPELLPKRDPESPDEAA